MVADGRPDVDETTFKAQIADLYNSLEKDEIQRSIVIIDAIGDNKNVLAIDPLTVLLGYPNAQVRSHAAQALDKLKGIGAAGPGTISPVWQSNPAKDEGMFTQVIPGDKNAISHVDTEPVSAIDKTSYNVPPGKDNKKHSKRTLTKIIVAGIAIILITIMAIAAGAFVYTILMPPVWSEQLPYKNSTGQYQSIVIYRNATDVPYSDVQNFIAAEKTPIEAAILADTKERPVEYAVELHDKAERQGINCSLIATGVSNGYPGHVCIAFNTKDRGMLFVDPTARNVSAMDYPGIDYSKMTLMRDTWVQDAGFLDGNNKEVYMTVYRNATPASYDALTKFLANDQTEDATYVDPTYTCANFATSLFNRAEAQGIKCGMVTVTFDGQKIGHAFNAFPTTDKGIVLIDDTGLVAAQKASGLAEFQTDAVVYLEKGKPLGELNLSRVDGHLDYSYYEEKRKIIDEFYDRLYEYEADVEAHNQAVDRYDADAAEYTAAVNDFNAKMATHNAAIDRFNAEEDAKYNQYQSDVISYEEYTSWYNTNIGKIPSAPTNGDQLDAWKARLNSDRTRLNNEMVLLNQRHVALLESEGCDWAVYSYWQPPDGVVNKIEYVW
jgi:hypothetical protein